MTSFMKRSLLFLLVLATTSVVLAQRNPFADAPLQYAPDRTFDLIHTAIDVDVEYEARRIVGKSVSIVVPLRDTEEMVLHAGTSLRIDGVRVEDQPVSFERDGRRLLIKTPVRRGFQINIEVRYHAEDLRGGGFGEEGGWHWVQPVDGNPYRVGFWTQGQTEYNSEWAPMWDYPNDFATSETRTTVPSEWTVIGNGDLIHKEARDGKTTYHWRMMRPHATYLISLVGGPLTIVEDMWRTTPLIYAVPRGLEHLIAPSFDDTPRMMNFFYEAIGVPYPWGKYAQNAVYDFGGGMENVSASTLGEGALADPRMGYRTMASLNAHELAHQWFGNLVTCKHWGDIWLNESFATYYDALYARYDRGENAYAQEIASNTRAYLNEARRYLRPLSTNRYPNADSLFDSHAYPKGAVILHHIRRMIGDTLFQESVKRYLEDHAFQPVESSNLERAFTLTTGINFRPYFDQWIYRPGHPVIEYAWAYAEGQIRVVVLQTQNTENGVPIYTIPTQVAVIDAGRVTTFPVLLQSREDVIEIPFQRRPAAVILDPYHDFLRDMKTPHTGEELLAVVRYAPNPVDREAALAQIASEIPERLVELRELLEEDRSAFPVFRTSRTLGQRKDPALRDFFLAELAHPHPRRRTDAVAGLGELPRDSETERALRALVTEDQYYGVVNEVLSVLVNWDRDSAFDMLARVVQMPSRRDTLSQNAGRHLAQTRRGQDHLLRLAGPGNPYETRRMALGALRFIEGRDADVLRVRRQALADEDWAVVVAAVRGIEPTLPSALQPAIREALDRNPPYAARFYLERLRRDEPVQTAA